MSARIIACRTLEKELLAVMARIGCNYPIHWLAAGQHNHKEARRAEIQAALDACPDCDTVLLAMSLCGGCATGLQSRNFRLVVPRCEDCITLLLGSQERRKDHPATYFLTEGWLAGSDNIQNEYARALQKHGKARADRIFSAMLANYQTMAFVDTGCADASAQIQSIAKDFGLSYARIDGTLAYLEDLLAENWDPQRFLVLEANATLTGDLCRPPHRVTVLPQNRFIFAPHGANLLDLLQKHDLAPAAPCGGNGKCGKCRVRVEQQEVLSCQTVVTRNLTVIVPEADKLQVLQEGFSAPGTFAPLKSGHLLAFDIGTTSVVCYLLSGETGAELAAVSAANPQVSFGADVISRIRGALSGNLEQLRDSIRRSMTELAESACKKAGIQPHQVGVVSVVGNPAMQQLFLGIRPDNLAAVPFAPVLTEATATPCADYLPICPNALLLTVPDIGGFVGADTLGCVLAAGLSQSKEITLLVDIGTNGELVLGNKDRLIACSTAAGPALEGANIQFGMRGASGAIDHVWLENGKIQHSVIGGGKATGICGSGLVDAVAVALEMGLLNKRGRILNEEHTIALTDDIFLTQEDTRQFQLAKGAIHAGILLMAKQLDISLLQIDRVLLAGAFGSHINPENACRAGLLPQELAGRITAIGNAAGSGAKMLAKDSILLETSEALARKIEFLELATLAEFPKTFAKSMTFTE